MSEIARTAIEDDESIKLDALKASALIQLREVRDLPGLEAYRVAFLGKASELMRLLKDVGTLPAAERPIRAALRNQLKDTLTRIVEEYRAKLEAEALTARLSAETIALMEASSMLVSIPAPKYAAPRASFTWM